MKKIVFLVFMCVLFNISNAQESKISPPEKKKPATEAETIVFAKTEHDFGVISQADGIVECEFTFKNTGKTPLVITKAQASCGCTVPDWSKEPIAPGKQGFVKATFNPNGTKGVFTKSITVLSDGNPSRISLRIKGDVH